MSTNTNGNTNPFDFLWKSVDEPVITKLPESGGGTFGLAGQWTCSIVYRFWTPENLDEFGIVPDGKRGTDGGTFCYFYDYEKAAEAGKKVGQQYGPNTVWRWEIPSANVVNIVDDEARAKFGDVITQEVTVSTLFSKKNRHELHMITLPSAVQAMALVAGFIDAKVFDYESLRVDPDVIDDAYRMETIGGETDYEKSKLWQARVKLWAALGETNPKAYTLNQGKFDATAGHLRLCLGLIYRKTEIWARVANVPDPRVDAKTKAGKHLQLPVIAQIWQSEADMRRELEIEDKPIAAPKGESVDGLALPSQWVGMADEWIGYVREVIKTYNGKPKPVIVADLRKRDGELQQQYAASADDFIAWIDKAA